MNSCISLILVAALVTATNSELLGCDNPHTHTEIPAHSELQPEPFDGPVTTLWFGQVTTFSDGIRPLMASSHSDKRAIRYVMQR